MKPILYTKTITTSLDKSTLVTTTVHEVYVDLPGNLRDFLVIETIYRGKRFDRAYNDKRTMDLESGQYLPGYHREEIDKKESIARIKEFEALPVKDIKVMLVNTTKIENFYLK